MFTTQAPRREWQSVERYSIVLVVFGSKIVIPQATTWLHEERYADERAAPTTQPVDEAKWPRRLQVCRARRDWPVIVYGSMPNSQGCHVLDRYVEATDGAGWARQRELAA